MKLISRIKQLLKVWVIPPGVVTLILKFKQSLLAESKRSTADLKLLNEVNDLKDIHRGKRCFILGGGSSIREQDLKKLKDECVISVSNTFVHPDYKTFQPKYHVVPHILEGHGQFYDKLKFVSWLEEMEEKTLNAEMFFHIGDRRLIEGNGLFKNRNIHWVDFVDRTKNNVLPINLSKIPSIWSVSELAITIAVYLGFDEIYLLGFDHDWFNGPLVYFYDHNKDHKVKPDVATLSFADSEFQMRRHADIFKRYKELFVVRRNIFNANANPKHYLDVFPKVEFNTLFDNEKKL